MTGGQANARWLAAVAAMRVSSASRSIGFLNAVPARAQVGETGQPDELDDCVATAYRDNDPRPDRHDRPERSVESFPNCATGGRGSGCESRADDSQPAAAQSAVARRATRFRGSFRSSRCRGRCDGRRPTSAADHPVSDGSHRTQTGTPAAYRAGSGPRKRSRRTWRIWSSW